MKNRSPIAVFLLGLITLGLYSWYWAVKTKGEMNAKGEHIPTAWIWLIPIVGTIWWYWKYAEGVEHVTNNKLSGVLAFILLYLLSGIGQAIIQDFFNKLEVVPTSTNPVADSPPPPPSPVVASPVVDQPAIAPEAPSVISPEVTTAATDPSAEQPALVSPAPSPDTPSASPQVIVPQVVQPDQPTTPPSPPNPPIIGAS